MRRALGSLGRARATPALAFALARAMLGWRRGPMSRHRMHTARALALAILATTAGASRARAAPTPLAVWLDGHDAIKLRAAIVAALPPDYAPLPQRDLL